MLDALAEGATLSEIALIPGMPQLRDVARWRSEVDGFEARYLAARATRADARVDAIAKTVRDMRKGEIDPGIGKAVVDGLKWLAGKDKPAEYGDAKPLIDARHIAVNGVLPSENRLETARWLTHILGQGIREVATPAPDAKPEHVAAMRGEIEQLLGRSVSDAELREALNDPRWRDVFDRMLDMLEGREPRPLPPPSPAPSPTARAPIEDAEIVEPDTSDPWRTGVARFDLRSGRLVSAGDARVTGLARANGRTVLLPDGNRTTFVAGEDDATIEARLASWYRDRDLVLQGEGSPQ